MRLGPKIRFTLAAASTAISISGCADAPEPAPQTTPLPASQESTEVPVQMGLVPRSAITPFYKGKKMVDMAAIEPADPKIAFAVGAIEQEDSHGCNVTVLGAFLAASVIHCISFNPEDQLQLSVQTNNGERLATMQNAATLPPGLLKKLDPDIPKAFTDDIETRYYWSAGDKALVLLSDDLSAEAGSMPIAALDSLNWQPMPTTGFSVADVSLLTHWPATDGVSSIFYKIACHVYRMNNVKGVVAHDCPSTHGVSGSPIVTEYEDNQFALVAFSQSILGDLPDPMYTTFAKALPDMVLVAFASVAEGLIDACNMLSNCKTTRDPVTGFTHLNLTGIN